MSNYYLSRDGINYSLYLVHHGTKGQKWGVKNGPPILQEIYQWKPQF